MLAKKTVKNQITVPKKIVDHFPDTDYFDVQEESGRIVLIPVRPSRADEIRAKLERLGITDEDVRDAVECARRRLRVVCDTNVVVSAPLFSRGRLAWGYPLR